MGNVKVSDKPKVTTMSDGDAVLGIFGNKMAQMSFGDLKNHLNDNDSLILNEIAFYIDINTVSSKGAERCDTGGSEHMRQLWEDAKVAALMDSNGNYAELNPKDMRYLKDGEQVVDASTGQLLAKWSKCDMMIIIPKYYGKVQTITAGSTTKLRSWFSLSPLPGGYEIPQQVVGVFKCYNQSGALRSIPGVVPTGEKNIRDFWDLAQSRSKNHGLANMDFRDYLLFHMMAKYGYRDSQGCKTSDGTLVWGVGLDGTESANNFGSQESIKTGSTLSLGLSDGKAAVTDKESKTCHSVTVAGFENPWGQYWEMMQGICSVGTDNYRWRANFVPPISPAPTAATFNNIEHVKLTRPMSSATEMHIVATKDGQGSYMIPKSGNGSISYNDGWWYSGSGQLWLFGGASNFGSSCGLASAHSDNGWSNSWTTFSARLAYYGDINKVSSSELARLVA